MHTAVIQRTGEILQSAINAEILATLFSFLDNIQAPFIIGGDWQNPPSELAAVVIQSKLKARIQATDSPSHLDYLLVSNELSGAINLELLGRPLETTLCFVAQIQLQPAQQLRTFPPIGRALHPEVSWSDFPEKNGPFFIFNYQITGLGTDLARWCTQSELYLTQQLQQRISS